jgi:hypothetical protein
VREASEGNETSSANATSDASGTSDASRKSDADRASHVNEVARQDSTPVPTADLLATVDSSSSSGNHEVLIPTSLSVKLVAVRRVQRAPRQLIQTCIHCYVRPTDADDLDDESR